MPLRSFVLELLAIDFLDGWGYAGKSAVYYDWMTRDFFGWLKGRFFPAVKVPGTGETIGLPNNDWKTRVESAYNRAVKACEYEANTRPDWAGEEWQKIFGDFIPSG